MKMNNEKKLESLLIALDRAINREEEKIIYMQIKLILDQEGR